MKLNSFIFISLILLSTITTSNAFTLDNCINEAKTKEEVKLCGNKVVPPLERKVEQEFSRLNKKFKSKPDVQTMLRLTKESWNNYRNLQCVFEKAASGGEETRQSLSTEGDRAFLKCAVRTLKEMESVLASYR